MAIVAKAGGGDGDFVNAPEGTHQAVCVDVVDRGMEVSKFVHETGPKKGQPKEQHKIEIIWQLSELMDDNRPYLIKKKYTLSLSEKSILRADLQSWRGKPFTAAELDGFDVEKLVGANCLLSVIHKPGNTAGRVFANVASVMPLLKGMAKIEASGYVRVCDRVTDTGHEDIAPNDSDIPFMWLAAAVTSGAMLLHAVLPVLV